MLVLDDELVEEAMKLSSAPNRSALIEEALRLFIQSRSAEKGRATYERRLWRLRQRLTNAAPRESARDMIRRDRERA